MISLKAFLRILVCFVMASIAVYTLFSCKKEVDENPFSLGRLTGNLNLINLDTAIQVEWGEAFTAWEGDNRKPVVKYEMEVSIDSNFIDEEFSVFHTVLDSQFFILNREQLVTEQVYFTRVRSVVGTNEHRSSWLYSSRFFILDSVPVINIFSAVKAQELTDDAVILRWGAYEDRVDRIVVTSTSSDDFMLDVPLRASDRSARNKTITGLLPGTEFVANLYTEADKDIGRAVFKTKPSVDGASYINLSNQPITSTLLSDAISAATDGGIIVLRRGETYELPSGFAFSRNVTIMSVPGFNSPAEIKINGWLEIASGANLDYIKFDDVALSGDKSSGYVFNMSYSFELKDLLFENCLLNDFRGVVRMKSPDPARIENFVLNNSLVTDIGNYGVLNVDNVAAKVDRIQLTASTIASAELILAGRSDVESMLISDCTLYQSPTSGRYVFDFNGRSVGEGLILRRSIFGLMPGARNFRASGTPIRQVVDTYASSDHGANDLIAGVTVSSDMSSAIFVNADSRDFTVKVAALQSFGDPRWRP